MSFQITATKDVNENACMQVTWVGGGTAPNVNIGITNSNNPQFAGYGYGFAYGSTNSVNAGGWGSGTSPVKTVGFNNNGNGFPLPIYITPCYLTDPTGLPPQGKSMYSSAVANNTNSTCSFTATGNTNAGIMVGVTAIGGGGLEGDAHTDVHPM